MNTAPHLKLMLQDLNKANCALLGVGRVLEAIGAEEQDPASKFGLKDDDYIKGCLYDGIDALTTLIMLRLSMMAEVSGIDVEL